MILSRQPDGSTLELDQDEVVGLLVPGATWEAWEAERRQRAERPRPAAKAKSSRLAELEAENFHLHAEVQRLRSLNNAFAEMLGVAGAPCPCFAEALEEAA